jgi:putative SOS response-associated peptidase YedK
MCGRYTQHHDADQVARKFGAKFDPNRPLPPFGLGYNIAPSQFVLTAARHHDATPTMVGMRWGLLPHWADPETLKTRPINARMETADKLPLFRASFKSKRCLIAADGFYEWKQIESGKIPHYITLPGGDLFAFAGLWDAWKPQEDGDLVYTCTLLTTEPNDFMARIHNRMPVILAPENYGEWLDPEYHDVEGLKRLARPWRGDMKAWPVDKMVNSPNNDNMSLIKPVSE